MKPIYEPRGAAKEYGDHALNIYTGCPHRCFYCFAPGVLRRDRDTFHAIIEPRKDIVEETRKQLEREKITGKTIHLCFTCDPYPTGYNTTLTREIIKLLKEHENHVQILTKGDGSRDFDLLGGEDWYGITISNLAGRAEANALHPSERLRLMKEAHDRGIKTWISAEPVLDAEQVMRALSDYRGYYDLVKIGKLNYFRSAIDWKWFGFAVQKLCEELGVQYYIKDSLRAEMEKVT